MTAEEKTFWAEMYKVAISNILKWSIANGAVKDVNSEAPHTVAARFADSALQRLREADKN